MPFCYTCGREVDKLTLHESCLQCDVILKSIDGISPYVHVSHDKSMLDGHFSASELRRIADVMDQVATTLVHAS